MTFKHCQTGFTFQGYTQQECADELQLPLGTVKPKQEELYCF